MPMPDETVTALLNALKAARPVTTDWGQDGPTNVADSYTCADETAAYEAWVYTVRKIAGVVQKQQGLRAAAFISLALKED